MLIHGWFELFSGGQVHKETINVGGNLELGTFEGLEGQVEEVFLETAVGGGRVVPTVAELVVKTLLRDLRSL